MFCRKRRATQALSVPHLPVPVAAWPNDVRAVSGSRIPCRRPASAAPEAALGGTAHAPLTPPARAGSAWKEWLPCVPHSTMAPRSARSGSYVSLSCSIQALSVVCQCFLRMESRVENAPRTSCATPDLCGARAAGKAHAQAGRGRAFCHALLFKLTTHCDK